MLKFSDANAKTSNLASVEGVAKYLAGGRKVYSLDLPSGVTCPGARDCHSWAKVDPQTGKATIKDGPFTQFRCFSASQEVQYPALRALRAHNKAEIDACGKSAAKIARLILASIPTNAGVVRLHVGGDFYSLQYMAAIVAVAAARGDVLFYFYTKSLHHLEVVVRDVPTADLARGVILPNLLVTGSKGGKYDHLLEVLGLRQAVVVYSEGGVLPIDHDDSHAATCGGDFALLIHGTQPKGSDAGKALSALRGVGSYSRK
jgi:hypothetical protein